MNMIIALDGSAASGKGTLAKRLAAHFDLAHLDTGSLYRGLALQLLDQGADVNNIDINQSIKESSQFNAAWANDLRIRTDAVAMMASKVAAIPKVRAHLLAFQRHFAANPPTGRGAILDGRDIGSVVLPDAPIKFFVDADIEVRAERRSKELQAAGQSAMFRDVLEEMQARDERDRNRDTAPLKAAADAKIIDTSFMDADQVMTEALAYIAELTTEQN